MIASSPSFSPTSYPQGYAPIKEKEEDFYERRVFGRIKVGSPDSAVRMPGLHAEPDLVSPELRTAGIAQSTAHLAHG